MQKKKKKKKKTPPQKYRKLAFYICSFHTGLQM